VGIWNQVVQHHYAPDIFCCSGGGDLLFLSSDLRAEHGGTEIYLLSDFTFDNCKNNGLLTWRIIQALGAVKHW
jgi:hypothetical protein